MLISPKNIIYEVDEKTALEILKNENIERTGAGLAEAKEIKEEAENKNNLTYNTLKDIYNKAYA